MEKTLYCSFRFAHYIVLVISRIKIKGLVNASKILKQHLATLLHATCCTRFATLY